MKLPLGHRHERDAEGRMTLIEHLRELRNRVGICLLALVPGTVVGWVFYEPLVRWLLRPVCDLPAGRFGGECGPLVVNGLLGPFNLQMTIAVAAGILLSCPVWLYQLWAFVAPALYRNERRWTLGFLGAGIPLFAFGVALCYLIMPKAVQVLLGFTPHGVSNLVRADEYLDILVRLMLVFGLAFETPVLVVALNLLGVLSARRLLGWWRQIVFGSFLFAAVATPTGDPFTMTALAAPIIVLLAVAYLICRFNDRRRPSHDDIDYSALGDDEVSPLDPRPSPLDDAMGEDTPQR